MSVGDFIREKRLSNTALCPDQIQTLHSTERWPMLCTFRKFSPRISWNSRQVIKFDPQVPPTSQKLWTQSLQTNTRLGGVLKDFFGCDFVKVTPNSCSVSPPCNIQFWKNSSENPWDVSNWLLGQTNTTSAISYHIWMFHDVSSNVGTPKWMVYNGQSY